MSSLHDLYSIVASLKTTQRQGWIYKGMDPDVIASHIYGAMCIGMYLAKKEKADVNKVVQMLLVHDWVMAKMEDVTPPSGKYTQKSDMEEKAKMVVAHLLPQNLRNDYLHLFKEFKESTTKEAQVARESDKLETLMQGETYEIKTGETKVLDTFFETYESVFKTKTGKEIFNDLRGRDLTRNK